MSRGSDRESRRAATEGQSRSVFATIGYAPSGLLFLFGLLGAFDATTQGNVITTVAAMSASSVIISTATFLFVVSMRIN